MIKYTAAGIIFLTGLFYLLMPVSYDSVHDFPPLPNSLKSDEPGDTAQNPNNSAYYSYLRRDEITSFYKRYYEQLKFFGIRIPALRLNHPPEYAYQYVKDQTVSTFLEEYTYPLRDSIFVNGYDPKIWNQIKNEHTNFFSDSIFIKGSYYASKTTLRYYPSDPVNRVIIYIISWLLLYLLFKVFTNSLKQY
jgi:hypothetical protein